MRLTLYTDYSLRILIYLAAPHRTDQWIATQEISTFYKISHHHLVKAVHHLGILHYVSIKRGRSGGIKLAKDPSDINLADIVRATEPDFYLTECFNKETNTCPITASCELKSILKTAHQSFFATLHQYSLKGVCK